jgi:hypothetical protein
MGWDLIALLLGLWVLAEVWIAIATSPLMPDDYDPRP